MLDFSWTELLLTSAVAVVVFGPEDIPKIMYNLGRVMRRLQYVKFAISRQFEDMMKEQDLDEIRRGVNFEAREPPPGDIEQDEGGTEDPEDGTAGPQ